MTVTRSPEWTVEQWVEHGRAWVLWKWQPGQVAIYETEQFLVIDIGDDGTASLVGIHASRDARGGWVWLCECTPDMRDPGTLGHAIAQVRGAWRDCTIVIEEAADVTGVVRWSILLWVPEDDVSDPHEFVADTLHEALLAAREAAP